MSSNSRIAPRSYESSSTALLIDPSESHLDLPLF